MNILVVDDNIKVREFLVDFLEEELDHQVTQCGNAEEAIKACASNTFNMLLTDIRMPPGISGIDLLKKLRAQNKDISPDIVLMTGYGDMSEAITAFRQGAYDYLLKPINVEELEAVVAKIEEHQLLISENWQFTNRFEEKVERATRASKVKLAQLQKAYSQLVGIGKVGVFSEKMRESVALAERFHQDRSVPVLIEGETGTGKEIIAKMVHYGQGETSTSFLSINCSAISANLFESELFGYESGAFTGAKKQGSIGKLELAKGGSLLLDEIGDMPLELQPKLLRVLQEREFYSVGGLKKIELDVRIICATNRNLVSLVKEKLFRRDLFYRLNVVRIYISPLRERKEDIVPLAQMFLEKYAEQKKLPLKVIQKKARIVLENHSWPGNIRELENAMERVVLLYDGNQLKAEHLNFLFSESEGDSFASKSIFDLNSIVLPPEGLKLQEVERIMLQKTLIKFDGNKTKAAAYLGLSRAAFSRKVEKLG